MRNPANSDADLLFDYWNKEVFNLTGVIKLSQAPGKEMELMKGTKTSMPTSMLTNEQRVFGDWGCLM